jgi:hypothetical protein
MPGFRDHLLYAAFHHLECKGPAMLHVSLKNITNDEGANVADAMLGNEPCPWLKPSIPASTMGFRRLTPEELAVLQALENHKKTCPQDPRMGGKELMKVAKIKATRFWIIMGLLVDAEVVDSNHNGYCLAG